MNLLLHCGARRVEREQLESSPYPASHQDVGADSAPSFACTNRSQAR